MCEERTPLLPNACKSSIACFSLMLAEAISSSNAPAALSCDASFNSVSRARAALTLAIAASLVSSVAACGPALTNSTNSAACFSASASFVAISLSPVSLTALFFATAAFIFSMFCCTFSNVLACPFSEGDKPWLIKLTCLPAVLALGIDVSSRMSPTVWSNFSAASFNSLLP